MFFEASSDNQFWKVSLGSGLTLLCSAAGRPILSVDDKLRIDTFLDSFSSVSVGTTNEKKKKKNQ